MLTHAQGSVLCGEPLQSIAQSQEFSLYHNVRKISIFQSPGNEECVYELWSRKSADIWPVQCNLFWMQSAICNFVQFIYFLFFLRWTLIGVTSAGFGCAVDKQPGIYHKVSICLMTECLRLLTFSQLIVTQNDGGFVSVSTFSLFPGKSRGKVRIRILRKLL